MKCLTVFNISHSSFHWTDSVTKDIPVMSLFIFMSLYLKKRVKRNLSYGQAEIFFFRDKNNYTCTFYKMWACYYCYIILWQLYIIAHLSLKKTTFKFFYTRFPRQIFILKSGLGFSFKIKYQLRRFVTLIFLFFEHFSLKRQESTLKRDYLIYLFPSLP